MEIGSVSDGRGKGGASRLWPARARRRRLASSHRRGSILAAACTAVAALPLAASAAVPASESYVWRNVEILGGGFVPGVVFHPAERDLIYARTDVGGAYRWLPESRAWQPLNDDFARDQARLLGVLSLALDPADPERVYLLCGQYLRHFGRPGALLASSDRGASWSIHALPFKVGGNEDGRAAGERLQVDPRDGNVLWLGSNNAGLWRSRDRGATWSRVDACPAQSLTLVAFAPVAGDDDDEAVSMVVGVNEPERGLLFSEDRGDSWRRLPGQPPGLIPNHVAFDSAGVMYVSCANHLGPNDMTDGAVWKFDVESGRGTDITPLRPRAGDRFGYGAVSAAADTPGVVVAATNDRWSKGDEIFRSVDGGATWSRLWEKSRTDAAGAEWIYWHEPPGEFVPHWMGDIDIDPHDTNRVLFVTGLGIFGTNNIAPDGEGGILWTFLNDGLEETVPQWLVSPPVGAPLVSALADIAGFRHDDLERSPSRGMHRPARGSSFSIDFAGQAPEFFVRTEARAEQRGFFSRDGARTWKPFAAFPPEAQRDGRGSIATSADARRLVWIPKGGPTYFSADNGATWTASRGGPVDPGAFATMIPVADQVDPAIFYVYDFVSGDVHRSIDGGATFSVATTLPEGGWPPRAVPGRRGHAWFPAETGLFVTRDAGGTFARIESVDKAYAVGFGRRAPGRDHPAVFLSGVVADEIGVFRSDDEGASWVRINDDQHQYGWIATLTGDPRVFGRVYLGTGGRGIIYGEPHF